MGLDFMPDERSLYLQSLENNTELYEPIIRQAQNKLANKLDFNNDKNSYTQHFVKALEILQQGIIRERLNEQQYIKNLINKIPTEPAELNKELNEKFNDIFKTKEDFNYNELIHLLNELLIGQKTYQNILNLEEKRLNQLEVAYDRMKTDFLKQEQIKSKQSETRSITYEATQEDFERYVEDTYLQRGTFFHTQFQKNFKQVLPTVDNLIATQITTAATNILDNNLIDLNSITDKSTFIKQMVSQLISQISPEVDNIIEAALGKIKYNNQTLIQNFIKEFDASLPVEKFFPVSYNERINEDDQISGEKLADSILNVKKQLLLLQNEKTAPPKNFTSLQKMNNLLALTKQKKDSKKTLLDLCNEILDLQEQDKKRISKTKKEANKQKIRNLKTQLSKEARAALQAQYDKATGQNRQELKKTISESLDKIKVKVSGSLVSEYIEQTVQSNVNIFWTGPSNHKADLMNIIISWPKIGFNGTEEQKEHVFKISSSFSREYNRLLGRQSIGGERQYAFSLSHGRKSFIKTSQMLMKRLQKEQEDNPDFHLEDFVNFIKNTISVTETVKTYNEYNNKLGFVAGSMGPDIMQQLNNFQEMFQEAGTGMTDTELTWLETALVNCSNAALGKENKEPLEKYLSVLAGFAIFDEGSIEIAKIAGTTVEEYNNTPEIMHLYKLNGLYFPGSYVLQRIFDHLKPTIQSTENLQTRNNDGVHIRAVANETVIVNKSNISQETRWALTYQHALKSSVTSIKVTFLSNLLGVVQQLNKAFQVNK